MGSSNNLAIIRNKFIALSGDFDERGRGRWAATEALALGWGGITIVAKATGLSDRTIRNGFKELRTAEPLHSSRQRRSGAEGNRWSIIRQIFTSRLNCWSNQLSAATHNHHCDGPVNV